MQKNEKIELCGVARAVAYRCEIVSEISCARPLAAFVSPSWLSGRPRPKIHVFRISLSVLRICSFFYPANPKIVAPKSTVSGQCASKFRGGNTLVFRCFPHRTSIYPRFVRFSRVFRVLLLTSFSLLLNKHFSPQSQVPCVFLWGVTHSHQQKISFQSS